MNLINVDCDKIEVTIAGITGFTFPNASDYPPAPSDLAHDILLLVALAFARLGQVARAAALIEIAWSRSQFAKHLAIYTRVAVAERAQSRRISKKFLLFRAKPAAS
ncbi:MAG TPA: hypothetical protein VFS67_08845 [Polyangiaceae bacterium]|nr:hypothetical protein [Polyangiaceae bacterium]